jgi:hypothetical protein
MRQGPMLPMIALYLPAPQTSNAFASTAPTVRYTAMGAVVFALSYATAYMETLTIAHVSFIACFLFV